MSNKRKVHSAAFKSKVALEALTERYSLSELAEKYTLHPNQISQWKKVATEGMGELFMRKRGPKAAAEQELIDRLYRQIGQLQVELDWLKKKVGQ